MGGLKTAYLIVAIRDNEFMGVDVFSERNPTIMGNTLLAVALEVQARTYQEAKDKCLEYARTYYPWLDLSKVRK